MKKVLSVLCMALLAGGLIFTSCTKKQYTITVKANNDDWGTVTGGGTFDDGATISLTATPNDGYRFVKWQDGSTDNPLSITVTADETWTAYFEEIPAPPAQPGVKVTFNNNNWDAGSIVAKYFSNNHAWDVYSAKQEGAFPIADVCVYSDQTGSCQGEVTANGQFENNCPIGWIEYYENNGIYFEEDENGQPLVVYGDWWAKNATVNITNFDATNLQLSSNVNATMFHATEAFTEGGSVDAASTAPMNVTITNCNLTSKQGTTNLAKRKHHTGYAKIAK